MRRAETKRAMGGMFQSRKGGSSPTSALQLFVHRIDTNLAIALNGEWHSRLPKIGRGSVNIQYPCFAATFEDTIYAVAIWSNPIARLLPQWEWLELRRFAIAPDAPKNTASRMLAVMVRLIRKQMPRIVHLISYQDTEAHTGCIYRAAGWTPVDVGGCREWKMPGRNRPATQSNAKKIRWEKQL